MFGRWCYRRQDNDILPRCYWKQKRKRNYQSHWPLHSSLPKQFGCADHKSLQQYCCAIGYSRCIKECIVESGGNGSQGRSKRRGRTRSLRPSGIRCGNQSTSIKEKLNIVSKLTTGMFHIKKRLIQGLLFYLNVIHFLRFAKSHYHDCYWQRAATNCWFPAMTPPLFICLPHRGFCFAPIPRHLHSLLILPLLCFCT